MTASSDDHTRRLALALLCQARALSGNNVREAATAIATELATSLPLRAVHLLLDFKGQARRHASSHLALADTSPQAQPLIDAAVNEALDQQTQLEAPSTHPDSLNITRAHAALAHHLGGWVCTVPIPVDDMPIGAILVEADSHVSLNADDIALIAQVAAHAGPVLQLRAARDAPLHQRLAKAFHPHDSSHPWYRGATAVITLTLAAVLAIPIPAGITAEARIEGEIQRALTAPADGYIERAFVRPGDVVHEGQILVELADREAKLERRKHESELAQHDNAFAAALSTADRAQMIVQRARADEARARIALIDHQLDRGLIRAPMDAIVLSGDLDQAQGTPVQRGEVLLVLAPQARYRLMIELDERDAHRLSAQASGQIALSAMPADAIDFTVVRVLPVAMQRDGRHFIEVEARLTSPPDAVKPGMRGYARIVTAPAPLAAQWTKRVRNWLRLQQWAWFGL
ncbi:HlyD family efflux transporter periplasmic adaptor subunit [Denitromonas halophila]|uniref:HlyD family efflux transporter periplasmic adaptor subunit n=1 Tax=Denitromonas halophila TaxID=1629404 RepID=A0A557QK43_9RHOO|nr:HlyD family efflux transporter periplasmic adaptor subunit [Denitromonas halophila]TVO53278.1 HlyD family efflux transporter periplasmic adaptor subunit [Denitromonas halophila]